MNNVPLQDMDDNNIDTWLKSYDKIVLKRLYVRIKTLLRNKQAGLVNRCVCCGIDMGSMNPRQLCRKSYCDGEPNEYYDMKFMQGENSNDSFQSVFSNSSNYSIYSTDSSLMRSL